MTRPTIPFACVRALTPFLSAALCMLTTASPGFAQASTRGHQLQDPLVVGRAFLHRPSADVVSTVALTPDSRNTDVFPALELDTLADGRRIIRGVSISQKGLEERLIFFEVDPSAATYRTYRPEDAPDVGPRELARHRAEATRRKIRIRCNCPQDPCNGSWTATVTTYDPAFVGLTETTADGSWLKVSISETKCRLMDAGTGGCWAANPSSLGTHWFQSSCAFFDARTFGVDYNSTGSYYNWDFGLDSLRTDVTQSVRIRLEHSIGVVASFSHTDSGEWSYLIYGSFYEAGDNTCFYGF